MIWIFLSASKMRIKKIASKMKIKTMKRSLMKNN